MNKMNNNMIKKLLSTSVKRILMLMLALTITGAAHAQSSLTGDVDGDGDVTISDVNMIINIILDGQQQAAAADVNGDGGVTIADVNVVIQRIISGPISPQDDEPDTETFNVRGVTFKMKAVQGGQFTMGATGSLARYANGDEFPVHEVILSDFSIGQTEVTMALWKAVMGSLNPVPPFYVPDD